MPRVSVGSIDASPRKAAWLKVLMRMNNESARARVGKAWEGHVPRFIQIYVYEVDYLARTHNLPWEAMFALLESDREMPYTAADLRWARQQEPTVFRHEELESRGRLGVELSPEMFGEELTARLSMEAVVAVETGFAAGLDIEQAMPAPGDLSPWAVGFRLARKHQEAQNDTENS